MLGPCSPPWPELLQVLHCHLMGEHAEFPVPLGRAILSPLVPFSETPCALCGDLIWEASQAGPGARVHDEKQWSGTHPPHSSSTHCQQHLGG